MSGPRLTINVHVDTDTPVEQSTFPARSQRPPFVALCIGVAGCEQVALLVTDPGVLTVLSAAALAARTDLVSALSDQADLADGAASAA